MIIYKITNTVNGKVYVGPPHYAIDGVNTNKIARLVIGICINLCVNTVLRILL